MKREGKLSVAIIAVLLSACGGPNSDESLPAVPRMLLTASGGLDVIHYGYINGLRYEASVGPDDLRDLDIVEAAMPPIDAVNLAKPALSAVGEDPSGFSVCGADLTLHSHRNRYYYLVAFCGEDEPRSVGFRVPVLLSGEFIQPVVAEDQW